MHKALLLSLLVPVVTAAPTLTQMMTFLKRYNEDWSFPRVTEIAATINYTAFSPDIVGRVDITNTFLGSQLNTEYIFGMFSEFGKSPTTSLIGVPLNQTISQLVIQGNTMSVSLIVTFNWTVTIIPVQFNTYFVFNDEGLVTEYDSQLVRSSWIFPTVFPKLIPQIAHELNLPATTDPTKLATLRAALDICTAHEQFCQGKNRQYKSNSECMDFIQNKIPLGDIWQAGQNTGICRYLHKAMVKFRPEVHCPHIGPTGGGMCVNTDYATLVEANPFAESIIQLPGGLTLQEGLALANNSF